MCRWSLVRPGERKRFRGAMAGWLRIPAYRTSSTVDFG